MAIVNYRPLTQNPNYLMLPKSPGGIEPNKTGGKIASGIADILEQGIKSADEVQKQFLENKARDIFEKVNQNTEEDLKRQIGENDTKLGNPDGGSSGSAYYSGDFGGSPSAIPVQKVDTGVSGTSTGGAEGALPEGSAPVQYTDDTAPGYPKLEDQPQPVQSAIKRQISVNQATEQGKFHDTGRQMEGEKMMSDLKAQFPGRTKEIDALASHYGITHNKSITTLQGLLNDQQTQLRQKQSADDKFEQEYAKYFIGDPATGRPGIFPTYFQQDKTWRNSPEVRNRLMSEIGAIQGHMQKNEQAQSDLALEKSDLESKKTKQEAILASDGFLRQGTALVGLGRQQGYVMSGDPGQAIKDFGTALQTEKDPKKLEYVQQQLQNYMTAYKQNELALANKIVVDKSTGTTALGLLGPERINNLSKQNLIAWQEMHDSITSKETGLLTSAARTATAVTDANKLAIVQDPNYKTIQTYGELKQALPNETLIEIIKRNDQPGSKTSTYTAADQLLASSTIATAAGKKDAVTGQPEKFSDYVNKYVNTFKINGENAPPARDMNAVLENTYQKIMNPKLPPDIQKNFATFLFGDDRALRLMKDSDMYTFMQKYAPPAVGEKIYSFGDQNLIANYKKMMGEAAAAAGRTFASEQSDVGRVAKLFNAPGIDVKYDPEKNKIVGNLPDPHSYAMMNAKDPMSAMVLEATMQNARQIVSQYNSILGHLEPIFKRDGAASVPTGLQQSIINSGIPVIETNTEGKGDKAPVKTGVMTKETAPQLMNPNPTDTTIQPTPVPTTPISGPQGRFEELQGQPNRDKRSELPAESQLASFSPQEPSASGSAGVQAINQAVSTNPIKDILRKAEGVKGAGGYNTVYGGDRYNLTNMTVSEVQQLQSTLPKDQRAVGAGQFIPKTLNSLVREMGLKGDEKFTPELQEKMIDTLLERRGYSQWKAGKMSDDTFINKLSEEWAGLPNSTGVSAYQGVAGNKATVSLASVKRALGRHRGE